MRDLSFPHSKVLRNGADGDDKQHRKSAAGGCLSFLLGGGRSHFDSRRQLVGNPFTYYKSRGGGGPIRMNSSASTCVGPSPPLHSINGHSATCLTDAFLRLFIGDDDDDAEEMNVTTSTILFHAAAWARCGGS